MTEVRKSIAFSTLESYTGSALQIISTVVVARILTPSDMGVFAVAAVFVGLAHMFRDFGIAEYLIQEQDLNQDRIRAAFTVNIAVSWMMCVVLLVLAPYAAEFYRTPGIADVLRVQAMNFVLVPFGAIAMAWFRREMNFKPVFVAGLLASVTQFVVTVVLAMRGYGYMSLAWASFAATIATVTTSVAMRPKGFPRWPGFQGLGRVIRFGRVAIGIYIFGQLGKGAPELIIGRALDMATVGLFSRAQGLGDILSRLVLRAIMPVYLPYFAKAVRSSGNPRREVLGSMSYLTAVGWPFLAFAGIAAEAVISVVYGSQWTGAAPLARILCLVAAIEVIYLPSKEALLSIGNVHAANRLQFVSQAIRVAGVLGGVPFGIDGVCYGLVVATIIVSWVTYRQLRELMGLSLRDTSSALVPSLRLTVVASIPVLVVQLWSPDWISMRLWTIFVGGGLAAIAWLVTVKSTAHPLWPEIDGVLGTIRRKLRF